MREHAAWTAVQKVIAKFKSADKYVFAIPMWNFGIPYRLKHYLDLVVQPTYTFAFDPQKGYQGLMESKPVLAIYARGGVYEEGAPAEAMDFQKRYMDALFGFLGFAEPKSIFVEPTIHEGPEAATKMKKDCIKQARELARSV